MLLPSLASRWVTSHIGKQVPQLAHAIVPYHRSIPCHATILPLVVGDSPGGFRIGWPYYLETGCCRIVWLYHTDRRLNFNQAFAAAVSGLFRLLWID